MGDGEIDWAEFQGGFWFDGWYPKIAIAVGVDVAGFNGGFVAEDVRGGALQHQGRIVFCVGAVGGGWIG